jgi:hypothetical protein
MCGFTVTPMPVVDSALPTPTPDDAIARIGSYDELIAICRRQVAALNINYSMLDVAAGFNVGYTSKLFAQSEYASSGGRRTKRHFSPESFDAYLQALGLDLVVVQNPDKVARSKAFLESKLLKREGPVRGAATDCHINFRLTHDFMRRIGRKGALARAAKMHAAALARQRISERQRAKALKRWRRQQVTSDHAPDPAA